MHDRKVNGGIAGGKATGIITATVAEKVEKGETLSKIEQRIHDRRVNGGKSLCIPRQSHFWSTKGENEDKDVTHVSVHEVWKYVVTNFKIEKVCSETTLQKKSKEFVEENGKNQLSTVDLKKTKLAKPIPFSVQYEKNLAYKGCCMQQNTKVKAKPKSEKKDVSI